MHRLQKMFYACTKHKLFARLSPENRYRLIHKNALGIFGQLAATCKPSIELAHNLDRLQRWFFARRTVFFAPRNEDVNLFQQRRQRASRRFCQEHGVWSAAVFKQFLKWHHHTCRRDSFKNRPWYVALLNWHGPAWLNEQRANSSRGTNTRVARGRPNARHADIVTRAIERPSQ